MGSDPAFLFYPGDYLRDTQCLSESAQVAYDRIMCEHMRYICEDMNNIIVPRDRIDFFIKRLSEQEKGEVYSVLVSKSDGFQIEWVAISISKRKIYSNSRSENRSKKDMKTYVKICKHMENEIENENKSVNIPEFLKEIWPSFVEMRKKIKKPLTDKAVELTIKQLEKLYPNNPEMQIKSIEQSIQRSWQGVFELKNEVINGKPLTDKFDSLSTNIEDV